MRIINILGLTIFIYLGIKYNIYISYIIYFNGLIFHTHENNEVIKLYDLLFNVFIALNMIYHCKNLLLYSLFIFIIYSFNNYLYKNKYISRIFCDIIHVFGVMIPSSYCLYLYNIQYKYEICKNNL